MRVIFVIGSQFIDQNGEIKELNPKENYLIFFAKNVELSFEYANKISSEYSVLSIAIIDVLFKDFEDGEFNFQLYNYTIHIKKVRKKIHTSIVPFELEFPDIFKSLPFLKEINIFNYLIFAIKNTIWSWPIFLSYCDYYLYFISFFIIIFFFFFTLKYNIPKVNLHQKKFILENLNNSF